MNLFNFKSTPEVLLEDYSVGSKGDDTLLNIDANRTGFFAWLLDKLSIKSRKVNFKFHKNYISYTTGGKDFDFLPTRDVHNYNIGYSNKKMYMVTSISLALFAVFTFFGLISESGIGAFISLLIIGGMSFLFFYLFKRSAAIAISFSCQNMASQGLRIKSGLSGKKISIEDLQKLIIVAITTAVLTGIACFYFTNKKLTGSFFSRWFNSVGYLSVIYDVILLVFIYAIFLFILNKIKSKSQ